MPVDLLKLENDIGIACYKNALTPNELKTTRKWINSEYCSTLYEFGRESTRHIGGQNPEKAGELSALYTFGIIQSSNDLGKKILDYVTSQLKDDTKIINTNIDNLLRTKAEAEAENNLELTSIIKDMFRIGLNI
ncbi:hypothetical protein HN924_01895 [Candidatus Woesearchaeota archaeon]|jgi:hypothetical protein|nr:hypothetical protein [Candidatus Woesearchaeota archaeon]MBT7062700.1 hypothetical protein [Candidatus Woesearchaeota archaeon]MBT7402467.1 hypothetical protein [Candidatus Woesearchaeota archaeon]